MNTKRKIKLPECLCGCGGRTKGGRFLPGHDAKLKKALVADARAGKKRAVNKLEKLGWLPPDLRERATKLEKVP